MSVALFLVAALAVTQGSTTPPSNGEAVAVTQGSTTPPSNGEAVAVTQGSTTPPSNGEAVAVTQGRTTPPSNGESNVGGHSVNSLLYSALQATGFTDSCVSGHLDHCSLIQELQENKEELQKVKDMVKLMLKTMSQPRHCKDLLDSGDNGSGLREVFPNPERPHHPVTVYCEQEVDGGGWTVFQRRVNNTIRQDFFRSWQEYQAGFGSLNGEFWLGLDNLHELASTQQELRIDLYDYEGQHRWAKYGIFQVGPEDTNYRLTVGRYSGNAGDSMEYHNDQEFTTHDADHDKDSSRNCAPAFRGAWWYNNCHHSNLNGYQYAGDNSPWAEGIVWRHWRGYVYSLMRTTMMLRPAI